jgi:hypothetical protein
VNEDILAVFERLTALVKKFGLLGQIAYVHTPEYPTDPVHWLLIDGGRNIELGRNEDDATGTLYVTWRLRLNGVQWEAIHERQKSVNSLKENPEVLEMMKRRLAESTDRT